MRRKLAILNPTVNSPATLLDDTFEVICVSPGEVTNLLGLEMRFHYTMHSIPCTGVELTMQNGATTRRALIIGDNNSRANIEQAANEGVLPPERLEQLLALYSWDGDLIIADAGAGLIHGVPSDFRDSPCPRVVCVHTPALPPEESGLYTLAEPGHRYALIAEHGQPSSLERAMAYRALAGAFTTVAPDELGAMLDASVGESVNRGQVVVRQGDRTDDLFVVLTGELTVAAGRRQKALIAPGEIFGEMAVITDAPRSATVRALTAARLIRIPGAAFRRFAAPLSPALPELWHNRSDLERVGIFARASVTVKNTLAGRAIRRTIAPGSTLIRQGSSSTTVYVLVKGRVQVYRGSDPLLVEGAPVILDPGAVIGETAPFLRKKRNASIVTLDECEVLAIRGRDFESIVRASPQLHHSIARVVRQRRAA
jgi:CRP-like cAMP-binding protein